MVFVDAVKRKKMVTVDGYSKAKTVKGAIADMGRYIAKHFNETEGNFLRKYKEDALLPAKCSDGGYYLEVEEVPCASRWHEDTEEMEYKDANYYVVCRFCK